nr:hypothetical protein [Sinomonas mesophila]
MTSGWGVADDYSEIWIAPFTDQISTPLSFFSVDAQPTAESKHG